MNLSQRKILFIAGISCALCVILGAFGAHALKKILQPEMLQAYETAVRYQFFHSLALILFSIMPEKFQGKGLNRASLFLILGILLFSGSLYGFTLAKALNIEYASFLGPVTPLGGMCFIIGWLLFSFQIYKKV